MKKSTLVICALFLTSFPVLATNIAIIDSGVDYQHEALKNKMWTNAAETPDNKIDDDSNGKIDDIYGWNFAENNGQVINHALQSTYTEEIEQFLTIQAKSMAGRATEGEKQWARSKVKDAEFIKKFQTYAGYAHGTHVAGISTRDNDQSRIVAVKLIPTAKKAFEDINIRVEQALFEGKEINWIAQFIFKAGMNVFGRLQSTIFNQVGDYINQQGVTVANGSFGVGMAQARSLVTPILTLLTRPEKPTEEQINHYAVFLVEQITHFQQKALARTPNVLYVFAAGNDGTNNDVLPTSPANVKLDNVITVGASISNVAFAPFSNFSATKVDLFAPGVGIRSSVPTPNLYLPMSGTSMAAPEVTRVAALIKETNPALQPKEIKAILMGTVDRKPFLAGKCYTEGVLNDLRALAAARLTLEMEVKAAIQQAKSDVADKPATELELDLTLSLFAPQ